MIIAIGVIAIWLLVLSAKVYEYYLKNNHLARVNEVMWVMIKGNEEKRKGTTAKATAKQGRKDSIRVINPVSKGSKGKGVKR